jgi:hypothetical protein
VDVLSIVVFSRREELRKVLTDIIFKNTVDKHLVDYNYNIEVRLPSNIMVDIVVLSK